MAFGVVRTCYSAPCRFFRDGERSYRIRWYFVPDDRQFYEGFHAFNPAVDEMFTPSGGEMELVRTKPNPRAYYSGRDINERPGTHIHGDAEDFLGLSLTGKYRHFGQGLLDPCAEPQVLPGLTKFGLRINELNTTKILRRGLKFGSTGVNVHRPGYELPGLLALGVVIDERHPSPLLPPVGLALGVVGLAVPVPVEVGLRGLALGVVGLDAKPIVLGLPGLALGVVGVAVEVPIEVGDVRFEMGFVGLEVKPLYEPLYTGLLLGRTETPYPLESRNAGMLLGLIGADVEAEIETLGAVLMLRVEGVDMPIEDNSLGFSMGVVGVNSDSADDPEISSLGLKLGLTVVDSAPPPPPTPGVICSDAGVLTLGTTYSYTIGSSSNWFKFPVAAGTTYFVKIITTSGFFVNAQVSSGASCGSTTPRFILNTPGTCNTYTPSGSEFVFVQVFGTLSGSSGYTILAGTGSCPP